MSLCRHHESLANGCHVKQLQQALGHFWQVATLGQSSKLPHGGHLSPPFTLERSRLWRRRLLCMLSPPQVRFTHDFPNFLLCLISMGPWWIPWKTSMTSSCPRAKAMSHRSLRNAESSSFQFCGSQANGFVQHSLACQESSFTHNNLLLDIIKL